MECLICFKSSDCITTTSDFKDQNSSSLSLSESICKLLNISHLDLDTFSRIFNSDDICSDCYERFVEVEKLFKDLDEIQLKLACIKNHIVEDLLKTQQKLNVQNQKGCQSEERIKLVKELLKTIEPEPSIKNDNNFADFFEPGQADGFGGGIEFQDVDSSLHNTTFTYPDCQDQAEHKPLKLNIIDIRDLKVILETMDLPSTSQTQSFNINEEPVKSIILKLKSQNRKPSNVKLRLRKSRKKSKSKNQKQKKVIKQIQIRNFDKFCKICNRKFDTYNKYMEDQDKHKGIINKPFKCDHCNLAFSKEHILISHIAIHGQGPEARQCHICGKWFSRNQLKQHMKRVHAEAQFICDFENCTQSYRTPLSLSDHKKRQHLEMKFECTICSRILKTSQGLKEHVLIAHEKKWKVFCTYKDCGKGYMKNCILQRHIDQSHLKIRNFVCEKCPAGPEEKRFVYARSLRLHDLKFHTPASEYEFRCRFCPKAFTLQKYLNNHEELHLGIKNFICHICSEGYTNQKGLSRHLKLHGPDGSINRKIKFVRRNKVQIIPLIEKSKEDL